MIRLCVLGEYIIDFTYQGKDDNGLPKYTQNPGGAPANVACAAAKLGTPAGIITKLSNDVFGRFLYSYAESLGCLDLRGVVRSDDPTGIAFALLDETGERDFQFYRHNCADAMLRPEDIREDLLEECSVLHFSSVSLAAEPARSATLHAARIARQKGKLVSFDINYRAPLWDDPEAAGSAVAEAMTLAHIVKASEEEAELFGALAPEEAARLFLEQGPALVLITAPIDRGFFAKVDCGIAVQNIALASWAMGYGNVILGMPRVAFEGERCDEFKQKFGIPADHEFIIGIAIGKATMTKDAHELNPDKISWIE